MQNRLSLSPPPASLATLRLVVTILIVVACIIGGTVLFSASRIGAKVIANPVPCYILAGVGAAMLAIQAFVPQLFRSRMRAATSDTQRLRIYGTETLTRVSMLEAAALMQYICYLLSMNEVTLAAGIVLVLAMLLLRPGEASYRRWCERA